MFAESSRYAVRVRESVKGSATHAGIDAGTVGLAIEDHDQPPSEPHLVTVRFEAEVLGYEVSDPDDEDQRYVHLYVERSNLELHTAVVVRLSERDSETVARALEAEAQEPTPSFMRAVAAREAQLKDTQ